MTNPGIGKSFFSQIGALIITQEHILSCHVKSHPANDGSDSFVIRSMIAKTHCETPLGNASKRSSESSEGPGDFFFPHRSERSTVMLNIDRALSNRLDLLF
jgi:hypothetical protein